MQAAKPHPTHGHADKILACQENFDKEMARLKKDLKYLEIFKRMESCDSFRREGTSPETDWKGRYDILKEFTKQVKDFELPFESAEFRQNVRFEVVHDKPAGRYKLEATIKHARVFVVCLMGKSLPNTAVADAAACMQRLSIVAQCMRLGTKLLGADNEPYEKAAGCAGYEYSPLIMAVGIPEGSPSMRHKLLSKAHGKRAEWDDVFSDSNWKINLSSSRAGDMRDALEAFRIAPCYNHAPMAMRKTHDDQKLEAVHFYGRDWSDLGVALVNFWLVANKECKLPGEFKRIPEGAPRPEDKNVEYALSYVWPQAQ